MSKISIDSFILVINRQIMFVEQIVLRTILINFSGIINFLSRNIVEIIFVSFFIEII
jgi:hypothetical protein